MREKNNRKYLIRVKFLCFLIFAVAFYSLPLRADVVYLKNGRKIEGEIQKQDAQRIYLKIKMGIIGVNRSEIEKIEKGEVKSGKTAVTDEKTKKPKKEKSKRKAKPELPRIKIAGRRIFKDNKLFFVKGINYSLNYPKMKDFKDIPLSVWEKDFQMIKKSGANTIRTYAPLPPELLDLAEKHQLMVIETVVYPNSLTNYNSPEQMRRLINEALGIVRRDKDRRCILMWSIWNDAPFHWDSGGNVVSRFGFKKVNKFLEEIHKAVKNEDGEHPVTASNMLDLPGSNLGFDFLDAVGINAFIGIGKDKEWSQGVYTRSKARRDVDKLVEISEEYNKPVYIAETGYSTFCQEEKQDEVIRSQLINCGRELAGVIIFEWADEWWKGGNPQVQDNHIEEHWGITDAYRKPKRGYKAVFEIFHSIRTESRGYFK